MYYSPVRHSHVKYKYSTFPFNLHVLSLPPAFVLSQDQTLKLMSNPVCLYYYQKNLL